MADILVKNTNFPYMSEKMQMLYSLSWYKYKMLIISRIGKDVKTNKQTKKTDTSELLVECK